MTALALVLLGFLLLMVFGRRVMRRLIVVAVCLVVAWYGVIFVGVLRDAFRCTPSSSRPRSPLDADTTLI